MTQNFKDIPNQFILATVLESTNTGVVITDNRLPDNPIIYCNPAFEELSGYSRDEIIGHNCRFLQGKDRNQSERFKVRTAISTGKSCVVEFRNYTKEGVLFFNELYLSPVKDDNGEITHFVGIQNNITSRKKAELALEFNRAETEREVHDRTKMLQESEEYLSSIIETIRESLVVLDKDYKILDINNHFLNTFKVTINDTKGKMLYNLGNGQWDIPELRKMMTEILPTNNPVLDYEVEHEFPHIGKKIMLLNAHRVEFEGQFKDRILLAIEDITDRKAIEQRKDDFLSIASHELKTPLTTVLGYMQIMSRMMPEHASSKFVAAFSKTQTQINRLYQLFSELLDMSKIQTGNIELHKDLFDFDKLVKETVDGMMTATPTSKIKIEGSTLTKIYADESHIVQVLNNLISNAVKYSSNADQVEVHLSRVSNFVKVTVTDHGMGIAADELHKIFQRFYRISSTQKAFPGMGIGLYICEQIIKSHGGTLWVESVVGEGATFSFTLPIGQGKEVEHA